MNSEKILFFLSMQFQKWNNKGVDFEKHECKEILVIKWDEIGDMVSALHIFELLKEAHSAAKISVHCKSFVNSLISKHPAIDKIYNNLKDIPLKPKKFDTIIDLRGTNQSFKKISVYRPKVYLGRGAIRYKNRGNQKHETVTNYEIVAPLLKSDQPSASPIIYLESKAAVEAANFVKVKLNGKPYAVFHVLARKKLRQWPLKRFAHIAGYLEKKYQLNTILVGAKSEEKELEESKTIFPEKTQVYCSNFGLQGFASLCKDATIFLGNESGPLQIAATYKNLPLIALYGPGVPNVFYPIGSNKRVLHHVLDCNPCDQVNCVQPNNPCIELIQTLDVQNEIDLLLKEKINL